MAAKYVIGVDGGTESIRAGVFDLQGKATACHQQDPKLTVILQGSDLCL